MPRIEKIYIHGSTAIITGGTIIGTYFIVADYLERHASPATQAAAATPLAEVAAMTPWWAYILVGVCALFLVTLWTRIAIAWWAKRKVATAKPAAAVESSQAPQFPKWPDPYAPVSVIGKTFRNERVVLDGHSYSSCKFEHVTLVYNGTTPTQMISCDFLRPVFDSDNQAVLGAWLLLYGAGMLREMFTIDAGPNNNIERSPWIGLPTAEGADHVALPPPQPLTQDQIAFRVALKQFALTYPQKLHDLVARVHGTLIEQAKMMGEHDYSYALFHAVHFAWSGSSKTVEQIIEAASAPIAEMDGDAVQNRIRNFFDEYVWDQKAIANLNKLAKMDLDSLPAAHKWLAADKDCWAELERLKVWPDTKWLRKITEDKMALTATNWKTPVKVNWGKSEGEG